jgi:hypothetical protein
MIGIVLIVLLSCAIGFTQAQEPDDAGAFTPSPELNDYMDEIERITSEIRELEPLDTVTRIFPRPDDVRAYLNESISGEDVERDFFEAQQFYIAFDLMPSDTMLMQTYIELLGDQIGGFYDTETDEMNIVLLNDITPQRALPLLEEIVYSHEFTHALQDQHFDLERLLTDDLVNAEPDRAQAVLSLVEGDATLVMTDYLTRLAEDQPLRVLAGIGSLTVAGSAEFPENTPPILITELTSPYLDGMEFVTALRDDGGWERVNQAYTDLPLSTEQILHPEKYLTGENPLPITLNNEQMPLDAPWERLFDRTLGEFFLREYLATQLAPRDAADMAAGWGGDRYHLYYNAETDQRAWVMRLAWDSALEADEFSEGYLKFIEMRLPEADQDGDCWTSAAETLCFVTIGEEHLISYAPTLQEAQQLLDSQREMVAA